MNQQTLSSTVSIQNYPEIALVTIDNPPVNALSGSVIDGLNEALNRIDADPRIRLWILCCAGRGFIAGADLKEIASGDRNRSNEAAELIHRIARNGKPSLAAIHGNALGGGFETALACDYRCSTGDARFGLPEVNLGAMPGYGGTQRLPRLVGYAKALEIMITGEPLTAREAKKIGFVDRIIKGGLLEGAFRFARELLARAPALKKIDALPIPADTDIDAFCTRALKLAERIRPGEDAPKLIVQSVRNTTLPIDEGLRNERALSTSRINADQGLAMRNLFFAERLVRKSPQLAQFTGSRSEILTALKEADADNNPFTLGNQLMQPLIKQIISLVNDGVNPGKLAVAFKDFGWQPEPLLALFDAAGLCPLELPGRGKVVDTDLLIESCAKAMFEAGNKLLAENPALQSTDLDVISCNAYGFPRFRGGVMYYGKRKFLSGDEAAG